MPKKVPMPALWDVQAIDHRSVIGTCRRALEAERLRGLHVDDQLNVLVSRQPFAEPEELLRCLSRYTHRLASPIAEDGLEIVIEM
jgi:hypothetical protein